MSKFDDGVWYLAFVVGELKEGEIEPTTKINAIKPICYEEFKSDRLAIIDYNNSLKLIKSVQLNIQEFLQSVVHYAADFMKTRDMSEEKFDLISLNFSRQFLNILSMFRSLIDHSDLSLSRKYGKDSEQMKKWKSILSEQYDFCFEYRLFYKLRNYCQHIGLPPMQISYTDNVYREGISFRLDLQREKLLEERSVWNQKIIQDLESSPEKIPVIECLNNWSGCFRSISKTLLDIKKNGAMEAAQRVLSHRKEHGLPLDVGQLCAVFFPTEDKKLKQLNLTLSWLPEGKADELLNGNPFENLKENA